MFERLQKPFLTVETGEAYQPIRLTYRLHQKDKLIALLNQLQCCEPTSQSHSWNWFWRDECDALNFESLESFQRDPQKPIRLATIIVRDEGLFINLSSFKRACLAVPFFDRIIDSKIAKIFRADFINQVFGLNERLPHGFAELFKEEELEKVVRQRITDYEKTKTRVERAPTAEQAFHILSDYTKAETQKKLPYTERYEFAETDSTADPDIIFLGFYIFLRGRELVAIRRWFGNPNYTLADAADETIEKVFGGMNIDIIE